MFRSAIFSFLLSFHACYGIYFYVTPEQRCFLFDVPLETNLRAEYLSPDSSEDKKVYLYIFPPRTPIRPSPVPDIEVVVKNKGMVLYTNKEPGEHWVCLRADTSVHNDLHMKFQLKLNLGESSEDYAEIAKKEHMDDLQLQLRKLRDRVRAIQKRQDFVKEKEIIFRSTSESNNSRAMWVSIGQIGILVASGILQARHLQGYFHKKKLV